MTNNDQQNNKQKTKGRNSLKPGMNSAAPERTSC